MNEMMMSSKEVRITSVELVGMINQFRELEGNRSELLHKNLMSKIQKEIETLQLVGIVNELNFKPVEYVDKKGESRPCYSLNRDGILQMCMSESTIVRYKVLEYVNKLESSLKQLQDKADLLLAIYNGGQEGILASKQLTAMEIGEATAPLVEAIEVQKPKVEFADRLLKTEDNILVREYAKALCNKGFAIGEKKLYQWLRDNKLLMSTNEPYQSFVNNEIFIVKVNVVERGEVRRQVRTTLITPKGQEYLFKKMRKAHIF